MRRGQWISLLVIAAIFAISVSSIAIRSWRLPGTDFQRGTDDTPLGLRLGLDLQGGVHLVYETVDPNPSPDALQGTIEVIRSRVDAFGVSEPLIQTLGTNRVVVQLPGVQDVQAAKDLIGSPAVLDFREIVLIQVDPTPVPAGDAEQPTDAAEETPVPEGTGTPAAEPQFRAEFVIASAVVDGSEIELTGERLVPGAAEVSFDPTTGAPEGILRFDRDGGRAFEIVSGRNVGNPLGIFLDGVAVSTPIIQSEIQASQNPRITGLSLEEARILSIQLNAGAFPTPLKPSPLLERDVDAFLGANALERGLRAGAIGLGLVVLFMVLFYRANGVVASAALTVYAAMVLSIFKVIPVVLTLSGLAAFVLSIGIAVDANVLVFERMKEELRAGRSLGSAVDIGFSRAWTAIRDGNFTTLIIAAVLYWFGDRLGANVVQGFAFTLAIGVGVSMFSALFVTRRFLNALVRSPLARRLNLFVP